MRGSSLTISSGTAAVSISKCSEQMVGLQLGDAQRFVEGELALRDETAQEGEHAVLAAVLLLCCWLHVSLLSLGFRGLGFGLLVFAVLRSRWVVAVFADDAVERLVQVVDGLAGHVAVLAAQVRLEARQVARDGVLGEGEDVGEAEAERFGDPAQLVGRGRGEGALLDPDDRAVVVHVGQLGELS